jgi:hypothetical protein
MDKPADELDEHLQRLDRRIESLRQHLSGMPSVHHGEPLLPPRNCPCCGQALVAGQVRLHGDLGTLLAFGLGLEDGWFQPEDGGAEERVLHTAKPRQAYRCAHCQTVLLPGSDHLYPRM